ncbi:MAG: D-inositol-3-phosphate glycosyltransferase [Firmicutes bacterium ADurb.BinA052]|nr:MAG: D-inositol-3-phosphate glycosyltransferase [Firmicutes bacterium ADurb.BinA052]
MRIAHVCYGLNVGGIQRVAVNLASAVAAAGHGSFYLYRVDGPMRQHLDSRVEPIRYGQGPLSYRNPLEMCKAALGLARLARKHQWDIIHTYDVMSWCVGVVAGRMTRIPVVRTQPNFIRRYEKLNARTLHILPFMRWTSMFHALQEATADDLVAAGVPPEKLFIELGIIRVDYPNRREQTRAIHGVTDSTKVVVSVGRLVAGKGWELVPTIAALVASEVPEVKFWIVGDGPLRTDLEYLISEASVGGVVELLGEQACVELFYEAADVALFPVATHAGMADATAFVPLVSGNGLCQREYLLQSKSGVLCEDGAEHYATALIQLLHDDDLRREYASAGQQDFRSRLSIEQGSGRFLDMYSGIVGRKVR